MEIGDQNRKRLVDNLTRLVFKELYLLLKDYLWYDHYHPVHNTLLEFCGIIIRCLVAPCLLRGYSYLLYLMTLWLAIRFRLLYIIFDLFSTEILNLMFLSIKLCYDALISTLATLCWDLVMSILLCKLLFLPVLALLLEVFRILRTYFP